MDQSLILVILALLAGLAIGWFLGSRPVAEWRARADSRDAEARAHEGTIKAMTVDLAAMAERTKALEASLAELQSVRRERDELAPALAAARQQAADAAALRAELSDARTSRETLRAELARMKADAANFEEQKRLLVEAQDALRKEFENAGNKVLEKAQEAFLARAQSRFEESEKTSAERLKSLLAPVDQRLKSYEEQVQNLEKQRVDAFGQLTGLIQSMRDGQEAVRAAAAQLGNSLRNGPKTRGRWGELQLRNVLEQCGLSEHTDFITEHSVETEEGRLRPDAIVRVPGNKLLVIDAKVSLNAYQDAFEAEDEDTRKIALNAHVQSMRNHIQTLGAKSYQSQFEEAPDYVLMFVPGEHFIAAALERDPALWDFAFERRVLLASPTNLVAIARTVAQVWRQDGLAREAREIGRMGGELYDRLAVAAEHLKRVGNGLDSAVSNYNKFVGSFERNVLSAGRRLRDKHIEIGKREIEEVPLVESAPRYAEAESPALAAIAGNERASAEGEPTAP
ncbi:MAG: DNA recombination protein RmuC [Novosphingobium meiothermophilum]|uniref:DNA recombination protein RmuC n=1 Tax=Novosphingobium TaxID=165696 RepID=UPI00191C6DF1|nr:MULTISPECIES: DNA recombination protein RmuC [Novosphingobium]